MYLCGRNIYWTFNLLIITKISPLSSFVPFKSFPGNNILNSIMIRDILFVNPDLERLPKRSQMLMTQLDVLC